MCGTLWIFMFKNCVDLFVSFLIHVNESDVEQHRVDPGLCFFEVWSVTWNISVWPHERESAAVSSYNLPSLFFYIISSQSLQQKRNRQQPVLRIVGPEHANVDWYPLHLFEVYLTSLIILISLHLITRFNMQTVFLHTEEIVPGRRQI